MTNETYWQTFVGDMSPEDFLRSFGTADPDLGLERFMEDKGHFYGVVNQGTWVETFTNPEQYHALTVRVYLRSYLEETRDDWQPALEAQPPKVVKRYRPVYDLPVPEASPKPAEDDDTQAPPEAAENVAEDRESAASEEPSPPSAAPADPEPQTPPAADPPEAEAEPADIPVANTPDTEAEPTDIPVANTPDTGASDDDNAGESHAEEADDKADRE